jgi:hypothetical protein
MIRTVQPADPAAAGRASLLSQAHDLRHARHAAELAEVTGRILANLAGASRAGLAPRVTAGLSSAAAGPGVPCRAPGAAREGPLYDIVHPARRAAPGDCRQVTCLGEGGTATG